LAEEKLLKLKEDFRLRSDVRLVRSLTLKIKATTTKGIKATNTKGKIHSRDAGG